MTEGATGTNWINGFELLCYGITLLFLIDVIRRRNREELLLFYWLAMHDLGVGTTREMRSVISGIFFPSLRCTAYTQLERINIWRGKALSRDFPVTKDAIVFNAFRDVPKLEIPIYILAGQYDYTCCYSLQEEYFDTVDAPQKAFYRFENAAHSQVYEEYEEGKRVLEEIRQNCP